MRVKRSSDGLAVHAIAGTYVVFLGFDLPKADCQGLLGFSIHRTDHTENEAYFLEGMKAFVETDPGFPAPALYSTEHHPIQSFQWADYTAKPGHSYTYTVTAHKGTPQNLTAHATVKVDVITESPEGGNQDVYFNRGTAASQAYIRRFGDVSPDDVQPPERAEEWLSRGLKEAMDKYILSCRPADELLIAAYEIHYDRFLEVVQEAAGNGVTVKIVYDARDSDLKQDNEDALQAAGLWNPGVVTFPRTQPKSYIQHNKFMVRVRNGTALSVWTGGTNFSRSGILGHSNVAHVVEYPDVADAFMQYWNILRQDKESTWTEPQVEAISPLPTGPLPPNGTRALFSPRTDLAALQWYANLAKNAAHGLFMTFAFGMNDLFKDAYMNGKSPFRLALMDKLTIGYRDPQKQAQELAKMKALRAMPENQVAVGNMIKTNAIDGWVPERLTGYSSHVKYIHNKFMLVDPLTTDPIVVAGSANFSDASIMENDENMVICRGNMRVADIYLGEFMRLYTHHRFREWLNRQDNPQNPPILKPLRTDDWWADNFGNTTRSTRRQYFVSDA